ncbi:MAG: GntR family transcriptional regulator [Devosia sp.]
MSRRAPFAGQIADRIREMIVHGDLQPDSRVVERALCEQLAVSRTPLREALKLLQAEGLVTLHQNRGARVTSFTAEQALTLFEVISGIEGLAAELACVRMSEIELASIEELHTKMKSHFELGEKEPYFELNSQIHDRIVQVSNNVELIAIHSNLLLRARRGRYMAIVDPRRWNEAMEEHEALMRAFRIRDPDLAGTVWRTHLRHTGETVGQVMTYANTLAGSTLPTEFA